MSGWEASIRLLEDALRSGTEKKSKNPREDAVRADGR